MNIILASNSPRRKELLATLVEDFEIIPSSFDENTVKSQILSPDNLVKKLSFEKANSVFNDVYNNYKDMVVIGSDTLIWFNNTVIGKPKNEDHAFNILNLLQGNTHFVYTGISVIMKKSDKTYIRNDFTKCSVTMKQMNTQEILNYIATKEPLDRAGAYAIQGIGKKYISSFSGNLQAIIGLDIDKLKEIFTDFGVIN